MNVNQVAMLEASLARLNTELAESKAEVEALNAVIKGEDVGRFGEHRSEVISELEQEVYDQSVEIEWLKNAAADDVEYVSPEPKVVARYVKRNAALEEAAKVADVYDPGDYEVLCEEYGQHDMEGWEPIPGEIATAIRKLKDGK